MHLIFTNQYLAGSLFLSRVLETPEASRLSKEEAEKIMHVALPIGKDNLIMATDALESMGHPFKPGNNFHLTIETDSEDEANKIFNALSAGGKITMPLAKTFWNAYFGMVNDKFGVQWMINYTLPASN